MGLTIHLSTRRVGKQPFQAATASRVRVLPIARAGGRRARSLATLPRRHGVPSWKSAARGSMRFERSREAPKTEEVSKNPFWETSSNKLPTTAKIVAFQPSYLRGFTWFASLLRRSCSSSSFRASVQRAYSHGKLLARVLKTTARAIESRRN